MNAIFTLPNASSQMLQKVTSFENANENKFLQYIFEIKCLINVLKSWLQNSLLSQAIRTL